MKISLTVLEIVLSLARLNHNFVHRSKSTSTVSQKTCECISIIKDRLFSKHTVQSDSSKTMEICVFRQIPPYGSSASTHDGTKYYSRTAKCKNNNVEVQTIKWYKSFFALPSTHNSAQLREKSAKISFARDG